MFRTSILIISTFFYIAFNYAYAQKSLFDSQVIEVKGQGRVFVQPDQFSLSLAIIKTGKSTHKLRSSVDHISDQVVRIAKDLGVSANHIDSARINLRVIRDRNTTPIAGVAVNQSIGAQDRGKIYVGVDEKPSNKDKNQRFELSRSIIVIFHDINQYDVFLNKIIKLGVERISPLSMSVKDSESYYQKALAKAIKNAYDKANNIAKQTNVSLGSMVYLKENSSNYYQPRMLSANMLNESSQHHTSQLQETAINANVIVQFAIKH